MRRGVGSDGRGKAQWLGIQEAFIFRPGSPFQWFRPLSLQKHTTINLGLARLGLNRPGNGEEVAFCGMHFFGIMASGGVLKHL